MKDDVLVIDYHLNHVTGSCFVAVDPNRYGCDCKRTWSPVDGHSTCCHFPKLLYQGEEVIDLKESVGCLKIKIQTKDGLVGWIDSIFVRKQ